MRNLIWPLAAAGAATLLYGSLVEAKRLTLERRTLRLPLWPDRLAGFRLAAIGDFHLHDEFTLELAEQALSMALDESPDMLVFLGDFVTMWHPHSVELVGRLLEPVLLMEGRAVAIAGNREWQMGTPDLIRPVLEEFNIHFLQNSAWRREGVIWAGVDSANANKALPELTMERARMIGSGPVVALWHEPDVVDRLPEGAALMLSGHSHGGQFTFPWGWTPVHSRNGQRYPRGFYPHASTPLYVNRGIGTTGPPSRLNCPPEVSILTLMPGDEPEMF